CERAGGGLKRAKVIQALARRSLGVEHDGSLLDARGNGLEEREQLAAESFIRIAEARDVAPWSRQACHKASPNRIGNDQEYDGNRRGFFLQHRGGRSAEGNKHIRT